jgi:soluble lytic murein transglycosylase-like protein
MLVHRQRRSPALPDRKHRPGTRPPRGLLPVTLVLLALAGGGAALAQPAADLRAAAPIQNGGLPTSPTATLTANGAGTAAAAPAPGASTAAAAASVTGATAARLAVASLTADDIFRPRVAEAALTGAAPEAPAATEDAGSLLAATLGAFVETPFANSEPSSAGADLPAAAASTPPLSPALAAVTGQPAAGGAVTDTPGAAAAPAAPPAPLPQPSLDFDAAQGVPGGRYGKIIYQVASHYSLSQRLVAAMVDVESAFRPRARSRKGACGLMQLLPATARRFGVPRRRDLFNPKKNIEVGVRYLRWLVDRFGADPARVLAAYNAGEGAVDRFGGVPPYAETRDYVTRIFAELGYAVMLDTAITTTDVVVGTK